MKLWNVSLLILIQLLGFSYGGLLATCFTSHLWRAGILLRVPLLQKNVMCITFGQPLISIPFVNNTILRFPALENTIHLVLNKQDKVPGVLRYFQLGCILKAQEKRDATCQTTVSEAILNHDRHTILVSLSYRIIILKVHLALNLHKL